MTDMARTCAAIGAHGQHSDRKETGTMKRKIAVCGLLLGLAACGETTQAKLTTAVYDTDASYKVLATPAADYVTGKFGTPDPTVKADIKTASAAAIAALTPLNTAVESSATISSSDVATAESDLAAFQKAISAALSSVAASKGQ